MRVSDCRKVSEGGVGESPQRDATVGVATRDQCERGRHRRPTKRGPVEVNMGKCHGREMTNLGCVSGGVRKTAMARSSIRHCQEPAGNQAISTTRTTRRRVKKASLGSGGKGGRPRSKWLVGDPRVTWQVYESEGE